jgi:hypothetical protein
MEALRQALAHTRPLRNWNWRAHGAPPEQERTREERLDYQPPPLVTKSFR